MSADEEKILEYAQRIVSLCRRVTFLENAIKDKSEYTRKLEEENRKLKYEYADSKRKRDKPLPYNWRMRGGNVRMYCPKCDTLISNWQRYCGACGQKIKQGKAEPENEIKEGPAEE